MIRDCIIAKSVIVHLNQKKNQKKVRTPLCLDNENVLTIMPERGKNNIVKFKDFHMQIIQPFMIIADF